MKVIRIRACGECPYYFWGNCKRLERDTDEERIPEDCPLKEV